MELYLIILLALVSILLIILFVKTLRKDKKIKSFIEYLIQSSQELYFCQLRLDRYLENDAFLRLESWLENGLCYQLSIIGMFLLKDYSSARLCRGNCYDENGQFMTKHSWVEFRLYGDHWYVLDLAWLSGFVIAPIDTYYANDFGRKEKKWECSYSEFWSFPISHSIYEAMQSPNTSNIWTELLGYGGPGDANWGFFEPILQDAELKYSFGGRCMYPEYTTYGSDRILSAAIFRDFALKAKRTIPKSRHVRIAESLYRELHSPT